MTKIAVINGKIAGSGWDLKSAPEICGGGEDEYCEAGGAIVAALAAVVGGSMDARLIEFYNRSASDLVKLADVMQSLDPEKAFGLYDDAAAEFRKAGNGGGISLMAEKKASALRTLGSQLAEKGRPQEAVERFRQAALLDPSHNVEIFKAAGDMFMELAKRSGTSQTEIWDYGRAAFDMSADSRKIFESASKRDHHGDGKMRLAELEAKMEIMGLWHVAVLSEGNADKTVAKNISGLLSGTTADVTYVEAMLGESSPEADSSRLLMVRMEIERMTQLVELVKSGHPENFAESKELTIGEKKALFDTALKFIEERNQLMGKGRLIEALMLNERALSLLVRSLHHRNQNQWKEAFRKARRLQAELHHRLDFSDTGYIRDKDRLTDTTARRQIAGLLERAEDGSLGIEEFYAGLARIFHEKQENVKEALRGEGGDLEVYMSVVVGREKMERFRELIRGNSRWVRERRGSRKGKGL